MKGGGEGVGEKNTSFLPHPLGLWSWFKSPAQPFFESSRREQRCVTSQRMVLQEAMLVNDQRQSLYFH